MAMITLKEYAIRHERDPTVMRHKAQRGGFKTAMKLGRDWIIDENEPLVDNRVKSGKFKDWRKPTSDEPTQEQQPSE